MFGQSEKNGTMPSLRAKVHRILEIDGDLWNSHLVTRLLGQKLQDLMFVFDNLMDVDDRGIQEILREVDSAKLVLALKGSDPAMLDKFMKNMSQRAAEMLKDDLESRGPVRLAEVEGAQKEIIAVARKLADAGKIMLGGSAAEQFV